MKKTTKVLLAATFALGLSPMAAWAAAPVQVTLPTFDVTLNGVKIDQNYNQYPLLLYKDITYVPMTYYDAKLLGLEPNWSMETGFSIAKAAVVLNGETARSQYQPYLTEQKNKATYQSALAAFSVQVQAKVIDNAQEPYPLLVFRDVTYFPLTWHFAVDEFGWNYSFDFQKGLVIDPVPTPVASTNRPSTVVVTGSVVNIRSGPGTTYGNVDQASSGDELQVVGASGQWYQVNLPKGGQGWIANWLVKDKGTTSGQVVNQGPPNTLGFNQFTPGVDKSILSLAIGADNPVQVTKSTAEKMVMTISNNTLGLIADQLSQMNTSQGPITKVGVLANGVNTVQLTLDLKPGAYCTVKTQGADLVINAYNRNSPASLGLQGKVIVLDPGHGGKDLGATGLILGVNDRDVGWGVAQQLKPLLEAKGAVVILTRSDNQTPLALEERAPIANRLEADVFLSIHADAMESNTQPSGGKVFYYAPSTTPTLAGQKYVRIELAECVSEGIASQTGRASGVRTENYGVLRDNDCPSVLIETGFLTNAEDEALLATDAFRLKIAQGICQGLEKYFGLY